MTSPSKSPPTSNPHRPHLPRLPDARQRLLERPYPRRHRSRRLVDEFTHLRTEFVIWPAPSVEVSSDLTQRGLCLGVEQIVPRLTREQRRQAIEGLLGRAQISSALVEQILNDAGDEPDQLPVLQHALMRTWSHWRKSSPENVRPINAADYEAIGGFAGALNLLVGLDLSSALTWKSQINPSPKWPEHYAGAGATDE